MSVVLKNSSNETQILSVEGGGTGAGTAEEALRNLGAGKTYVASFTASSASSNNQTISNTITIPAGTYLLVASLPILSASTGAFSIETAASNVVENKYMNGSSYATLVVVATFTAQVSLHMAWNASAAVNFSYLERGGLKAVRLG